MGIFTAFTNRQNNNFSRREREHAGDDRVLGGVGGGYSGNFWTLSGSSPSCVTHTHSAMRYMSAFFLSSYLANLQWHLIEQELPARCGVCGGPLSTQHAALSNHMKTSNDEQCNDWQRAPGKRPHWQITLSTSLSRFLSAHPRQTPGFSPKRIHFFHLYLIRQVLLRLRTSFPKESWPCGTKISKLKQFKVNSCS